MRPLLKRASAFIFILTVIACSKSTNFVVAQPPVQRGFGPSQIHGRVTNAVDARPLATVKVTVHWGGPTGPVAQTLQTDQDGNYQYGPAAPGTYSVDFEFDGYISLMGQHAVLVAGQSTELDVTLSEKLSQGQFRAVLNWIDGATGAPISAVRDVDSYLAVPGFDRPIDYNNKAPAGYGADLDVDDTQWSGPETVTIRTVQMTGTYTYYVNNFNLRCQSNDLGLTALGRSEIVIHVYNDQGLIRTYHVPPGSGLNWIAFQIVNGQFHDVQAYDNSLYMEDSTNNCSP